MIKVKYDVTEVVQKFLRGQYGEQRNALMREFGNAFRDSPTLKCFLAEICQESMKNKQQPVVSMAQGMAYGMTLGVLLEQERQKLQRGR